jgi:hypothetical protein
MRLGLSLLLAAILLGVTLAAPAAEAARGCPSGYTRVGRKCVKYVKRYKCRAGCHYVGNGMCRCRRR